MGKGDHQRERIREIFREKKVQSLVGLSGRLGIGDRMVQRYLKDVRSLSSYTHRGQYVTLPDMAMALR